METEIKEKLNFNYADIFFMGEDLSIFYSLKDLSSQLKSFTIERTKFSKNITKNNNFFLIDDSLNNFDKKISFLHENNFTNFFVLINKEGLKISEEKDHKVFLKPLKIFELHREICNKISKNIKGRGLWKLNRAKLKFYKNNKNFINLTEKEFYFLFSLLQRKGSSVSKKQLLVQVWKLPDSHSISNTRVVETLVSGIRKKLKKIPKAPKIIKDDTGYKLLL